MGRRRRGELRLGPTMVEVRIRADALPRRDTGADPKPRKPVSMSEQSRRNMMKAAFNFPWQELGEICLVTLTYPAGYPNDCAAAKRDMDALWKRWRRSFGEPVRGMWGLEWQDREAPHFHVAVGLPARLSAEGEYGVAGLRSWGFRAWSECVSAGGVKFSLSGAEYEQDRRMGLRFHVSPSLFAGERAGVKIAEYFVRHAGKGAQKAVPEGAQNVGRYWGVLGEGRSRSRAVRKVELCCEHGAVQAARVVRAVSRVGVQRQRQEGYERWVACGMVESKRPRWLMSRKERRDYRRWQRERRRIRTVRPAGAWRRVWSGYEFERLVEWSRSVCPIHGGEAAWQAN
jgi:hypothetical protein